MRLRFKVDQGEALGQGHDAPTSIATIEIDPSKLNQEERNALADRMDGIDVRELRRSTHDTLQRSERHITATLPTFDALVVAVRANEGKVQLAPQAGTRSVEKQFTNPVRERFVDFRFRKKMYSALQDYLHAHPVVGADRALKRPRKEIIAFFKQRLRDERLETKAKALMDYRRNDPLKVIAIRYGYSVASVSLWAKSAGLERRRQGCRIKDWPRDIDLKIVDEVRAVVDGTPTLAEIGKRWHMSRSNIHRIYKTWKHWTPKVPFKPGDIIRFERRDYRVIEPGVLEGKVRSLETDQESIIHWGPDGHAVVTL